MLDHRQTCCSVCMWPTTYKA